MRNIITNRSIANVVRFSAQATVMLRGNRITALDSWHATCAGTSDTSATSRRNLLVAFEQSPGLTLVESEQGKHYLPLRSQRTVKPTVLASTTFQRIS
ncbi:MAG: hypothetical protein AAFN77_08970 [Planctomycetota bacterium]